MNLKLQGNMKVFAVYWFAVAMTLATTTARPQENTEQQQQVNVEEVLQQAQNNAGGFFPSISGNEGGFYNYNPGYGYGPEFGGQQAETGQFFGPDAQTSVDGSHLSPQESQGELSSYLSPTHGEMSMFPVDSLKEEAIPTETHVPPQDNKSPNSDISLPSSPFAVDEVPNFSAFGQFGGNGATQSQNLIQGRKLYDQDTVFFTKQRIT